MSDQGQGARGRGRGRGGNRGGGEGRESAGGQQGDGGQQGNSRGRGRGRGQNKSGGGGSSQGEHGGGGQGQGGPQRHGNYQREEGYESQAGSQSQGEFQSRGGHQRQGGYQNQGGHQSQGGYQRQGGSQNQEGYQRQGGSQNQGGYQRQGGYQKSFGGGGRGPRPTFKPEGDCTDPYAAEITPERRQELEADHLGWKLQSFPETKEEMTLHKYTGLEPVWQDRRIKVSVNHFVVLSTKKKPNSLPLSETIYHYDISYEVDRKKKEGPQPGPSGAKKRKRVTSPDVSDVASQLEGASLSDRPPKKKLPKRLTKIILDYLIPKLCRESGFYGIATDGSFNLYSTKRLQDGGASGVNIPLENDVTFDDLLTAGLMEEKDEGKIKVTFEFTHHTINASDVAKYFQTQGTLRGFTFAPELKQSLEAAWNAVVKGFPDYQYFSVGRSTMVPRIPLKTMDIGGGVMAWRGVAANITMGWKPYLNVDNANCAFVANKDVLDVIQQVIRSTPARARDATQWNKKEYDNLKFILSTCKITYMPGALKLGATIRGLADHQRTVSDLTFRWEDRKNPNKTISVYDYFLEKYGKRLKFKNGPVLKIRNESMVPAELCKIKEGQSYNRKLDGFQTSKMLTFARRDPKDLKSDIENHVKDFNLEKNEVLKELQVQIPNKMLEMDARVLVPPTLRYGKSKEGVAHIEPKDGTWEIFGSDHNYPFYKTLDVTKWGVLAVGCTNLQGPQDLTKFIQRLKANGGKKGVNFRADPFLIKALRDTGMPDENRKALVSSFSEDFNGCEIVLVVTPTKNSDVYGHIKHAAEIDVGILTQCVIQDNVLKCQDATVNNLLLKINSKLGGVNHVVVPPFNPEKAKQFTKLVMGCPMLIMGADVTHAPPGSKKVIEGYGDFPMPSYAAVTGNVDKTCMPFMTEVRAQRKANAGAAEVIQDMETIAFNMIAKFEENANIKPIKIIYFRDGVGDGQFPELLHVEMGAIRRACTRIGGQSYQPKITFITVQKRHKTRIFHDDENAPAGTVIDEEIVHPTEIDFYLLSHKGMLGTSRPSRYHVLWDDSNFSKDILQSLAYTLCYMYVRCTKSVKMPAATYYAHLAAERAKKLCEDFEAKHGPPTVDNLNMMLSRNPDFIDRYPMHFV